MVDIIDGSENISVHGILNWVLLLTIFSIITVVGNYIGYKHPIGDALIGMFLLSLITLIGVWMERYLPLDISSIIYISIIGKISTELSKFSSELEHVVKLFVKKISNL